MHAKSSRAELVVVADIGGRLICHRRAHKPKPIRPRRLGGFAIGAADPVSDRAVAEDVHVTQSPDYLARFRANAALHGNVRNYQSLGLAYRVKRSSRERWAIGVGV